MKRIVTVSGMMLFLVLALTIPAQSQSDTAAIAGVVRDTSGVLVPGVTVTVSGPIGEPSITAVTDTDGKYSVSGIKPGKYTVSAATAETSVRRIYFADLASGASKQLDITYYPGGGGSPRRSSPFVIPPRGDQTYK